VRLPVIHRRIPSPLGASVFPEIIRKKRRVGPDQSLGNGRNSVRGRPCNREQAEHLCGRHRRLPPGSCGKTFRPGAAWFDRSKVRRQYTLSE